MSPSSLIHLYYTPFLISQLHSSNHAFTFSNLLYLSSHFILSSSCQHPSIISTISPFDTLSFIYNTNLRTNNTSQDMSIRQYTIPNSQLHSHSQKLTVSFISFLTACQYPSIISTIHSSSFPTPSVGYIFLTKTRSFDCCPQWSSYFHNYW